MIGVAIASYGPDIKRAIWPQHDEDEFALRTRVAIAILVFTIPTLYLLMYAGSRQQQRLAEAIEDGLSAQAQSSFAPPINDLDDPPLQSANDNSPNEAVAVLEYATPTPFYDEPTPFIPPPAIPTALHWVFFPQLSCVMIALFLSPALGRSCMIDPISLSMIWWSSTALYWASFIIIGKMRRLPLTQFDVFLIRFGFWPLLMATGFILHAVRDALLIY